MIRAIDCFVLAFYFYVWTDWREEAFQNLYVFNDLIYLEVHNVCKYYKIEIKCWHTYNMLT